MQRVGALCSHRLGIEAFQNLQHLKGDETVRRGRQFVNVIAPVVRSDWVHPIRAMIGKVFKSKQAAFLFRTTDDLLGDFTPIKNLCAFSGNPSRPRMSTATSAPVIASKPVA